MRSPTTRHFWVAGVVCEQGEGFEAGEGFAAAGGVLDVAVVAVLVDGLDDVS